MIYLIKGNSKGKSKEKSSENIGKKHAGTWTDEVTWNTTNWQTKGNTPT